MNPLDTPLCVTFFQDHAAQHADPQTLTLRAFAKQVEDTQAEAKSALPWIKLARFGDQRTAKGSLRHNGNMIEVSGIELDYDDKAVTPAEAAKRLRRAGVAALVYTSPSHTLEAPKWRVLAPLSGRVPPESRYELAGRLNTAIGSIAATESFTASQAFYFGATPAGDDHHTILVDGDFLDDVDGLQPTYPARKAVEAIALPQRSLNQSANEYAQSVLATSILEFEGIEAEGRRHHVLLSVTFTVAPFVLGGFLDRVEAEETIAASMGRPANGGEVEGAMEGAMARANAYVHANGDEFPELPALPPPENPPLREITEDHAARIFAGAMRRRFKYDHTAEQWFVFRPDIGWEQDKRREVVESIRRFLDNARAQWGSDKEAMKAASAGFISAVGRLAQSDPAFAVCQEDWDADPFVLGVPGGYVDLRTGAHHRADPLCLVRKRASVAPSPDPAPVWTRFLDEATGGDAELQAWLQRQAGYYLTGDVSEETFAFVHGPGGNGKGVFLRTLSAILEDYAYQAPAEMFKADSRTKQEYQLANMDGIRLVMVSETEAGTTMAEALVKEFTGNEGKITARQIYGRAFNFRSQAKLLIIGNHAPKLTGRTAAMERRMRVVPFTHTPASPDLALKDRLVEEYPSILAWMIAGCLAWQTERGGMCDAVKQASGSYFEEQDTLAQWMRDRCDQDPDASSPSSSLLEDFNAWSRERGERSTHARDFKSAMESRFPTLTFVRVKAGICVRGVALVPDLGGLLD